MKDPTRISFILIALVLILTGWLHLAVPLLAVLFALFALNKLHWSPNKWYAISLFIVLVMGIAYGAGHFLRAAVVALPRIAEASIPSLIAWAESHHIELPFSDYESLKTLGLETAKEQAHYLGNFANMARGATTEFVFLLIGIVVAVSLFLNSELDLDRGKHPLANNLYSRCCVEISNRFRTFYESFATVMGAQIVISAINTVLTAIFLIVLGLPYTLVVVGVTFLSGLLPVVGNLISNSIIVCVAFTVSPKTALVALVFLIVVHKLEYFLNSKIIGQRIRNPVWLTLLGLIVGERLLGLPGMILAPVLLNYVKVEAARVEADEDPPSRILV